MNNFEVIQQNIKGEWCRVIPFVQLLFHLYLTIA